MKKVFLLLVLIFSQHICANWIYSLDEAKLIALNSNKFILVEYYFSESSEMRRFNLDSWSNEAILKSADSFVLLRMPFDSNSFSGNNKINKKNINFLKLSLLQILDCNGKIIDNLEYSLIKKQLTDLLNNYSISTEFLSVDLMSCYKNTCFNTSARVAQKYLDFSLLVDNEIKSNILKVSDEYLSEAKKDLSKKDDDYNKKYQKLELLELFRFAYSLNFTKLEKKLVQFKEIDILENNLNYYYFLNYMVAKGLGKENFAEIDSKYKLIEGFDYFIKKSELILFKKV